MCIDGRALRVEAVVRWVHSRPGFTHEALFKDMHAAAAKHQNTSSMGDKFWRNPYRTHCVLGGGPPDTGVFANPNKHNQ